MFKGSHRSLRSARIVSFVVISAVIAGCGGASAPVVAPSAEKTQDAVEANARLEALFTSAPSPTRAATTISSDADIPPPIDPEDPEDTEPLPATPGSEIADAEQKACTDDAQFTVAEVWSNPEALVNRHVLCVKQDFEQSVDLKDKDGAIQIHSGDMKLATRWSVHGVHNKLEKKATLSLSYNYTENNDLPVPKLNVIAKISCITQGSASPEVNCDMVMPAVSLSSGEKVTQDMVIPLAWSPTVEKIREVTIKVRLFYTTDNSTPVEMEDGSVSTTALYPYFNSWVLRCDVDKLRAGWKGCVFNAAPAVWKAVSNTDTQYARKHIADVFAKNMSEVPGLFKLAPGKRSEALNYGQYLPLTRAGITERKNNRAAAKNRCATPIDADDAKAIGQYCTSEMSCDCDEYPPASAEEGAYQRSPDMFSVRKILRSDNQKAGSQLGAMYSKERVLIGDKFRIYVGDVSVPPPTPQPPSPPGPVLRLSAPQPGAAGIMDYYASTFGKPPVTPSSLGALANIANQTGEAGPGCSQFNAANISAVKGRVAIISRGGCTFAVKVKNAQNAGAVAVVLANNAGGSFKPGGNDATITIPSCGVTEMAGAQFKSAVVGALPYGTRATPGTATLYFTSDATRVQAPAPAVVME
jgi:hypothetical protein